ncbi:MAG: hypothetical protein Q7J32_15890 [Sphingomonadaceae bacterium]|nr:hypothetical protein [Sphingomonadaceae bacterium]
MKQKFDAAAISLLMFTVVLTVWLGVGGPTNTAALKDWQTLMAAVVALGAATLAYNAAMAKVRFDERTAVQNECRKVLGIFLRFDFAVDVLRYEAELMAELTEQPATPTENNTVIVDDLTFNEMPEIKEAWSNLDYFPVELSRSFYSVQNARYNFAEFKKSHAGETYPCEYGMTRSDDLDELRALLVDLHDHCVAALRQVRVDIATLRTRIGP